MARELTTIRASIRTTRQSKPELVDLNGPESASDYALWEDVIAYIIWLFEVLCDKFKAEVQTIVDSNVFGTLPWWQQKVLEFQYDAVNAQVVQEINFVAKYPVIDPTLRIINRSSVRNVIENDRLLVSIKVAKLVSGSLVPLSDTEMAAFVDYTLKIGPPVRKKIVSLFPDRLKLSATIYYSGQYGVNLVKSNVAAAIANYCLFISSGELAGEVKLSVLEDYIQAVPGVTDVVITEARGRDQATSVNLSTVFNRVYDTAAGYIIPEDTAGHTLADTLTMIADV